MPDCNIRNVDKSLLTAMKAEALKSGRTLRDWAIWVWAANVGFEVEKGPLPEIQRGPNVDGREAGKVIEGEKAPGRVRERAGEILGNETAGIGRGAEALPREEFHGEGLGKMVSGQGGSADESGDVADAAGNEHGCSVVESPVVEVPDLEVEVDEAPFVDEQEIEEVKPPDCPYCDHVLMLWMRPGPNKGKWACAECDKAFTVEGLRRLGR